MVEMCVHDIPLNKECRDCGIPPTLAAAARAYLAFQEEIAKGSYREWNGEEWLWNDEIWERTEPDEFKLVKALREALRYEWIRT